MTPEEYFDAERGSTIRHEYYQGHMYAMSGGASAHSAIVANVGGELHSALKKTPYRLFSSDLRIRVSPDGLYTYPDQSVVCGEPQFAEGRNDTLLNLTVIVEVLSKSTEAYDRGFKFAQYRRIESLREYALLSQTEPRVEILLRLSSGEWLLHEYVGMDAICHFESIDVKLLLADIYDQVTFPTEETAR